MVWSHKNYTVAFAIVLLQLLAISRSCLGNDSVRLMITELQGEAQPGSKCKETDSSGAAEWTCNNLQAGLELVNYFNDTNSTISMLLPPGQHVLDSPVHLGNISMELIGLQDTSGSPVTIECKYNIAVDQDQIFNLSYVYTDYTLYFNHSKSVSISNINMSSCQFPLRLDTIGRVEIRNCSFQLFTEAVLDIYNTLDATIMGCTFFNNSGTGISRFPFRGNTGAVSIGFNNVIVDKNIWPAIIVSNCNFTDNRATANLSFLTTDNALLRQVYTGRGGALGIFINESKYHTIIDIYNNVFVRNYARSFGGGVYVVIFGQNTQHIVRVSRSVFEDNVAIVGAGALVVTFYSIGVREIPHTVILSDCSFTRNVGESGGAVLIGITDQVNSFVEMERCNFTNNKGIGSRTDLGSAFAAWLVSDFRGRDPLPKYHITDCIFDDNNGSNGVVSLAYVPFAFYGRSTFSHNRGTSSLRIIGSLVQVYGTLNFFRNEVAALELLSSSQMQLQNGARMEFRGNKGRLGSSIIVSNGISLRTFSTLAYNPQCFLLYSDRYKPPSQWRNVSVVFRGNEAVLSSSVHASTFSDCTWSSLFYPYFNPRSVLEWALWDLGNDSINTGYEDKYAQRFHIGTEARVIDTPKTGIVAWPGRKFSLPLTGWDEFNNPTAAVTRFNFINKGHAKVSILPQVVVTEAGGADSTLVSDFQLKYTLSQKANLSTNTSIGEVVINVPFESSEVTGDKFELYSSLCPGGYEVSGNSRTGMKCQCLEQTEGRIVNCEQDQDSIIVQNGYWVSVTSSSDTHNQLMYFYTCPAGYCRCVQETSVGVNRCVYLYVNSNPDAQCTCNRHGILCGECKGQGVSALFNRCVKCSNANAILIALLVIEQVLVFAIIVLVDKQFMTLLYPFTFYIQVMPFSGSYFHETFLNAGEYLHYLSSILSFYFPYDFCLYSNMDPLVSFFFRFLPFVVAILVIPLTYVIRHVKWKRKLKHHGLWTIVILIYSHTIHTCMSVLNCPRIIYRDGSSIPRWFASGNVECFTGGHLPLALLSLLVMLLLLMLIPSSAAIAIGKPPLLLKWKLMEHFHSSLSLGFKDQYRGWAGVELGRRALFIFLVVLFPREKVAVLLLLCIVFALYGFCQPYESMKLNIIELTVQLNSIILLVFVSSGILEPYYNLPPVNIENAVVPCAASKSTAPATWILLPFYYFPVLLLLIIFLTHTGTITRNIILIIKSWKIKVMLAYQQRKRVLNEDSDVMDSMQFNNDYILLNTVTLNEVRLTDKGTDQDLQVISVKNHNSIY